MVVNARVVKDAGSFVVGSLLCERVDQTPEKQKQKQKQIPLGRPKCCAGWYLVTGVSGVGGVTGVSGVSGLSGVRGLSGLSERVN